METNRWVNINIYLKRTYRYRYIVEYYPAIKRRKSYHLLQYGWTLRALCLTKQVIERQILNGSFSIWIDKGFPGGASGKEPTCQCRRCKRYRFNPWAWKIPWMRVWQLTPVFLLGKSHGQWSLEGYSPYGHKELDMTKVTYHARESEWEDGLALIIMILCLPLLSVQPPIHFFTAAHSLGLTDSERSHTMLEQDLVSAGTPSPKRQASFLRWPYMLVNLVFASCLGIFINSTSFLPVKLSLAEKQSMWSPYWFPFLLPFLTSTSITTQICQEISDFTEWLEELTRSKLENFQQNLIHVIFLEVQQEKTGYILIFIGSTHGHTPVSNVSPILNCT